MAKDNKTVPLIAGGALLLFLMMGSKKSSAKSSGGGSGTGELPDGGGINVPTGDEATPSPDNGGQQNPKDPSWDTNFDPGPVTAQEKYAADLVMYGAGVSINPAYYPPPYNKKKDNQSMIDWKTNVTFWTVYSTSQSPWVKEGNKAIPFKITVGMKDASKWAAIWKRIRNWIAYRYPDVAGNEIYEVASTDKKIVEGWPYFQ